MMASTSSATTSASSKTAQPQPIPMPRMIYGTAWKAERTEELVYNAIKAGFRGIDTAAIEKHYNEHGVGKAVRRAVREGIVRRSDLWIQTKVFPHDPAFAALKTVREQVNASVRQSLCRLFVKGEQTDETYLDAVFLHSPYPTQEENVEAWEALCDWVDPRTTSSGPDPKPQVRCLGISNISVSTKEDLEQLLTKSRVPPTIIQNRYHLNADFDYALREYLEEAPFPPELHHPMGQERYYQGYWTLVANRDIWDNDENIVAMLRKRMGILGEDGHPIDKAALWYVLLMADDVVVLNGTKDVEHMKSDIEAWDKVIKWRNEKELNEWYWQLYFERFWAGVWGEPEILTNPFDEEEQIFEWMSTCINNL